MNPICTGVVGFGLAGRVFHASFIHAVPALSLDYIVQRTGSEAHDAYPSAHQLRSFDDLLATDVELVAIATPNATHFPLTRQALLAGKYVVCDKPLTATLAEAEELEDLARSSGRLLFPFHNRRFDGDYLTLRDILASGQLGRIATVDSRFDRYRPQPRANSWRETQGADGNLLMDIGPHLIDQALALFGTPLSVAASLRIDRTLSQVVDAFDVVLTFPSTDERTLRVTLGGTILAAQPAPRYRVHGTGGSYTKFGLDPQEDAIRAGTTVPSLTSNVPWLAESESQWGTLNLAPDADEPAARKVTCVPTQLGDYRNFYSNVAAAIRGQAQPAITPRDAVRVARIIDMATRSSHTGCTVAIDPTDW